MQMWEIVMSAHCTFHNIIMIYTSQSVYWTQNSNAEIYVDAMHSSSIHTHRTAMEGAVCARDRLQNVVKY